MSKITDLFTKELKGQEMRPPIGDSRVFVQGAGWNTSKYFGKYYESPLPYPALFLGNNDDGTVYLSITKEIALVKEIFKRYWKDENVLGKIEGEFKLLGSRVDELYFLLNEKFISNHKFSDCLSNFEKFEETIWNLNALVFFSIYFDKQVAVDLLKELEINITEDRFNEIWARAVVPVGISFEKRRMLYLWNLIKENRDWDDIADLCQYFLTSYARVPSLTEVKKRLSEEYHVSKEAAAKLIEEELSNLEIKKKEYDSWLITLSPTEKKLIIFTQFVIQIRDERKDFLMKATTIFHRVGSKLFSEAGIDPADVYHWSIPEIKKGVDYLRKNANLIEKRKKGYTLFISYDGSRVEDYDAYLENKKDIASFYLKQHGGPSSGSDSPAVIKGQIGSKGKVVGRVSVINNFDQEKYKFKAGEILVTGMTRPEYVPLMKISSGVITDEGGITCHAAIVSRELKIPCVIGTKVATQVLKDGDMVEVDADNGIVRIIK